MMEFNEEKMEVFENILPVRHYAANQRQDNQEYFSLILTFRASPAD